MQIPIPARFSHREEPRGGISGCGRGRTGNKDPKKPSRGKHRQNLGLGWEREKEWAEPGEPESRDALGGDQRHGGKGEGGSQPPGNANYSRDAALELREGPPGLPLGVPADPGPVPLPVPLLGSPINVGALSVPPLPLSGFLGRKIARFFEEIGENVTARVLPVPGLWSDPASSLPAFLGRKMRKFGFREGFLSLRGEN